MPRQKILSAVWIEAADGAQSCREDVAAETPV